MDLSGLAAAYLRSRWARVAAVTLLVGLTGWFFTWAQFTDVEVYRIGARVWLDGGELYGSLPPSDANVRLPFTYPPVSAVLFAVLAIVPRPVAIVGFTLASVAAFAASIALLFRAVTKRGWREALWLAVPVAAVGLLSEPMLATLRLGQINTVLLLLVVADLVAGPGKRWHGALIGLAMAIKLTPAVFLAYFLVRRDWRALAMGIGSALAYTAFGFLAAPSDSVQYWAHTLRDPSRIGTLSYVGNQSLNGLLVRFGLEGGSTVWFVLCAVLGLGLLYVMYRLVAVGEELAAWSLMGIYSLLASPVSWSHHWVWALPALMVLAAWARRSRIALGLGVAGVALAMTYAIWQFPAEEHRELEWGLLGRVVGNGYVWWGLVYVVLAAVWALLDRRSGWREARA